MTLLGSLATYDGDPNEMVLVTVPGLVQAAQQTDPDIASFLTAAVGDACPGYYASQGELVTDSLAASQEIYNNTGYIPPCTWVRRYAPLMFQGSFNTNPPNVNFDSGQWLLQATFLKITRLRTFAIESNDCFEAAEVYRSFLYTGGRPQIISPHLNTPFCDYPQGVSAFSPDGTGLIASPNAEFEFKNGTGTIVLVSPDTSPANPPPLEGGTFMPLPPIPDGYPAPPNTPPPLQGQAVLDALSDDNCKTICIRGGAFLTWWDIGNRAPNQEVGERQWLQTQTITMGDLNTEIMPDVVTNASEQILTQTAQIVLGKILDKVVDAGTVIIKSGGANKILTILGPAGKIIQTIEIASELIQEIQMLLGQLYVPQCVGSNRPNVVGTLAMVPIPFPVQTLDGQSTLNGMQAICDALFKLMQCCPPCVTDGWHQGPDLTDAFDWYPEFTFSAILFQIIEVKYRENASMSGQDKLGWFKWIEQDDANLTFADINTPIWVNGDLAVFRPQNDFTKGVRWVPQSGVSVRLFYKFAPQEWEMNRFLAPQIP